jgi:hypothetical protein
MSLICYLLLWLVNDTDRQYCFPFAGVLIYPKQLALLENPELSDLTNINNIHEKENFTNDLNGAH